MNLYMRSIGFTNLDSEGESRFVDEIIKESIRSKTIIKHPILNRALIIARASQTSGIYIYGRFEGDTFIFEYAYPFLLGKSRMISENISVERHADKESYAVVSEESESGITLIFYLQNIMDYLEYLTDEKGLACRDYNLDIRSEMEEVELASRQISLTGMSLSGTILLPTMDENESHKMNKSDMNRQRLIKAARNGDEKAIESLTLEDIDKYNEITQRIMKEDVFTIVDSSFMPCGVECDQYKVVGKIIEVDTEVNILTSEEIYVMLLECNDMSITVAIAKKDLLGEPAVGRRFNGRIWLQGSVKFYVE